VFEFVPHAVVPVVIVIAIFCLGIPRADHPAALATMAPRIRVWDVMTEVILTDLRGNRASVHSARSVTFSSHPFHPNSLIALLQMLPKVFWFIVIVPSVEGAHQRVSAQLGRVAKFRFHYVGLLVCSLQLWVVPVGSQC
jgi:hypothetical protein